MIAIIKYNAGNVSSVKNAVERLGFQCIVTDNETEIREADKVILPGVGEARSAMKYLRARGLDTLIISLKQPVLGICLGMQLMCRYSEEGNTTCMGIFDTAVLQFPPQNLVPHMGWNNLQNIRSQLFCNISPEEPVYFVHSYYAETEKYTTSVCDYILPFAASMERNNFYATQFHPEKSSTAGEQILLNFLNIVS